MADVFVSYASEDRDRITPIIDSVEQAGFTVWWDRRIGLGASFDREIERELEAASCVIVIWSEYSIESDWVRNEAQEGLDRGVLLPILIDNVRPPLAFRRAQAAQLVGRVSDDELNRVVSSIATIATGTTASVAVHHDGGSSRISRLPQYLSGLAAVAIFIVASYWWVGRDDSDANPVTHETEITHNSVKKGGLGGTEDDEAYKFYLIGSELFNSDPNRALIALTNAVEFDPEFALAWVRVAFAHAAISRDPSKTSAALSEMSMAAARAVSAAPNLWEAHNALGWYLMARRDFLGTDRAFQKAAELANDSGTLPHPGYTQYLYMIGRHEERQSLIEQVQNRLDALVPSAENLYFLGRRDEALAELKVSRGAHTYIGVKWWENLETWLAIERGDANELDDRLLMGTELEGLWGTPAFLEVLRASASTDLSLPRQQLAYFAIFAAEHGDIELALTFLRMEYLRDAYGGFHLIWHPALSQVRKTEGFKSFLQDLGLLKLFQSTENWNDYCKPTTADDFHCSK